MSEELRTSEELDQRESAANGSVHGYRVQARYNFSQPKMIAGQALDNRWRYIDFAQAPEGLGVPRGHFFQDNDLAAAGCYGYTSAQALRWWFHAEADKHFDGTCLETRLVKFEISYQRKWKAVSHHVEIGGDDRSNMMPDWGKK